MSATSMPLVEMGVLNANVSPNITLTKIDKLLQEVVEVIVVSPDGFSISDGESAPAPWPANVPLQLNISQTLSDVDARTITKYSFSGTSALTWIAKGAALHCAT